MMIDALETSVLDRGASFPVQQSNPASEHEYDFAGRVGSPQRFLRRRRRLAARRERDRELAAVFHVGGTTEIAPQHQRIHQLSRRLLRDAQFLHQLAEGNAARAHRQAADHIHAVLGDVVAVDLGKRLAHRRAIGSAGVAQQSGDDDGIVSGWLRMAHCLPLMCKRDADRQLT